MKIGIHLSPTKNAGGAYQYSLALLEALVGIPDNKYVVFGSSKDIGGIIKKRKGVKVVDRQEGSGKVTPKIKNGLSYLFTYFFFNFLGNSILNSIYKFVQRENIKKIENEKLDLIFYSTPSNLSFLANTPSVVPVHDLMHRAKPDFPEVSALGRWENREYVYRNLTKKAYRILVDSDVGKNDVVKYYGADEGKITILRFLPPSTLNDKMSLSEAKKICKTLGLPDSFIFYPAKFWPHKNHLNLIKTIHVIKKKGRSVNLVLTGSKEADFSSFEDMMSLVGEYDLDDQIFYLGYVSDEEISAIYKLAKAMVMPTYFGPTNIPVYEAWKMGTPVIYSNIRGCREQLGDAGLFINPHSPADIANKILRIYTQPDLTAQLRSKGFSRLARWSIKDFSSTIRDIINEYKKNKGIKIHKGRNIFKQQ